MFKNAQVSYADFLIGLLILIIITFIFIQTVVDLNKGEEDFKTLINDGASISNSLMSRGYCPSGNCLNDWNSNPPEGRLGFVYNSKIILNNFNDFIQLVSTEQGYIKSKIMFGVNSDYVLYFEYGNQIISPTYGRVNDLALLNTKNSIKITRIIYYNLDDSGQITEDGRVVKMVIFVLGKERASISDQLICTRAEEVNFCSILEDLVPEYRQDCCSSWDKCCSGF